MFIIALQNIKDFPDASKVISSNGVHSLNLFPLIFIPSIVLEVALLTSDVVCNAAVNVCNYSGLYYLTSQFPHLRRIFIYSLLIMVLQLWQSSLHQFPRWDIVFKNINLVKRLCFLIAVFTLSILTSMVLFLPYVYDSINFKGSINKIAFFYQLSKISHQTWLCLTVTGWTAWLLLFYPHLIHIHGEAWSKRVTQQSIENLASYLRLSQVFILGVLFIGICLQNGLLEAQLDITFVTILIPTLYCAIYLIALITMKAGTNLLLYGILFSFILAIVIPYLAKNNGKGSVILVFFHVFGKIISYFGEDEGHILGSDEDYNEHETNFGTIPTDETKILENSLNLRSRSNDSNNSFYIGQSESPSTTPRRLIDADQDSSKHTGYGYFSSETSSAADLLSRRSLSNAEQLLAERGQEHSSLVMHYKLFCHQLMTILKIG